MTYRPKIRQKQCRDKKKKRRIKILIIQKKKRKTGIEMTTLKKFKAIIIQILSRS